MSVRKMADVWEYSQFAGTKKLLLLAIADHANDEGIAYPGMTRLAYKIKCSVRYTQLILQQILDAQPAELVILEHGGVGTRFAEGHLYQVVIEPHDHGLSKVLAARRAAQKAGGDTRLTPGNGKVGGEARLTPPLRPASPLPRGGPHPSPEAGLTLTTTEPSINHHTTTTPPAAAVEMGKGEWNWEWIGAATKLPRKSVEALSSSASQPAAFVALYLYGLSATGIKTPKLWASRQLLENPVAVAGDPYDSLAQIAPARLAALCGWMRDGGALPELGGLMGAALAWRGFMNGKFSKPEALATAADQALNELGITGLVVKENITLDRAPAGKPAELDVWQRMLSNGLSAELSPAALQRLRRCHLVADNGTEGIVVGVPAAHDYDWLARQMAYQLERLHRITLVPAYSK